MEQKHSFKTIFLRIAGIAISVREKKSKPFKRFVQILSSQGKNTRSDQITDHQTGGPYDTFFLKSLIIPPPDKKFLYRTV